LPKPKNDINNINDNNYDVNDCSDTLIWENFISDIAITYINSKFRLFFYNIYCWIILNRIESSKNFVYNEKDEDDLLSSPGSSTFNDELKSLSSLIRFSHSFSSSTQFLTNVLNNLCGLYANALKGVVSTTGYLSFS
jgi:hypothetical protein